jgi:acetylornithine deacetylase/succinyl-diaminopimelate desuccinylase-like protein
VFGISVAEKKRIWLKIRASGVAGHGSQPHDQNPNDHLTKAITRLLADPPSGAQFALVDAMRQRIGALAPNKFTNAIQRSTIALTWLRSGVGDPPKINVIPSVAEAGLDCRVLPGTTTEQWIAELNRRLADPTLTIEVIDQSDDPVVTPQDTPLYRSLDAAIHRQHPDAVVTPILIPYGTDANTFRPRGVKSYGIFPAVLSAEAVASMHGDAERVPLDGIREAAQVFFEALRDTLKAR